MGWWRRLQSTVRRDNVEQTLDDELCFHLEERTDELVRTGLSPEAARREARKRFGSVALNRERTRDVDLLRWLESLCQDFRFALRALRRAPALVAVSVLSLGLGLGLNLALYSALTTVFWHEPTMVDPDRVVGVEIGDYRQISYPNYVDLRDSAIFSDVMAFRPASLRGAPGEGSLAAAVVTANFFEGLGIRVAIGRTFDAREATPERSPRVLVLTHEFWNARFGGDPAAIGQTLRLNKELFTVIGVLPQSFKAIFGFAEPSAYVPVSALTYSTLQDRGSAGLTILARLRNDGSPEQAAAAVTAFGRQLEAQYPEKNEGMGRPSQVFEARAIQLRGTPAGFVPFSLLLATLFGFVLLLGSVNVAGLLLARGVTRRHELAVRVALGAGRLRVMQALLVEGFVLTALGAIAGLTLTILFSRIQVPLVFEAAQFLVRPDMRLLGPGLALVAITTLLCGLVPAFRATRPGLVATLRQEENSHTGSLTTRNIFVVAQVAMSLTLLVVATLFLRSQARVFAADVGFNLDRGVVARVQLAQERDTPAVRIALAEKVTERLGQLPGVLSSTVASMVPLGGDAILASFHPAGRSDIPGVRPLTTSIGPRYFETLQIPLRRGREFLPEDRAGKPAVAIVNETFARTYFPNANALGQRIHIGGESRAEIVGVAADNKMDTIGEAPKSVVYYPFAQRPRRLLAIVRTAASPDLSVTAVSREVADLDPTADIGVGTLRNAVSLEMQMRRSGTALVGSLGVVGLFLTTIGLYGVVTYLVASRTVEIGIRMALGASPAQLHWMVVRNAAVLILTGIAIGGMLAMLLGRALVTFLAGLSPLDPLAYAAATAVLIAAGLLAAYLPARRVMRVDPMTALRQ